MFHALKSTLTVGSHSPSRGRRALRVAAPVVASATGALLIAMGLAGVVGGEYPPTPPAPGESAALAPASTAEPVSPLPPSEPVRLTIPALDLDTARFVPLGLAADGEIEVPEDAGTVGWYEDGPWPGQPGPAVMGAHVDAEAGPGVFHQLGELRPGDQIEVARADHRTATFTVERVERYPKDDFPTQEVYGSTGGRAELRLVTCGGEFDRAEGRYRDNIVAYAVLTATEPGETA